MVFLDLELFELEFANLGSRLAFEKRIFYMKMHVTNGQAYEAPMASVIQLQSKVAILDFSTGLGYQPEDPMPEDDIVFP